MTIAPTMHDCQNERYPHPSGFSASPEWISLSPTAPAPRQDRRVPRGASDSVTFDAAYFLDTAKLLVTTDRAEDYGDMVENHKNIMRLWNAYLFPREPGRQLTLLDIPVLMILMKVARLRQGAIKADTFADICGYGAIAGRLAFIE
jgi:hypothetical protein